MILEYTVLLPSFEHNLFYVKRYKKMCFKPTFKIPHNLHFPEGIGFIMSHNPTEACVLYNDQMPKDKNSQRLDWLNCQSAAHSLAVP